MAAEVSKGPDDGADGVGVDGVGCEEQRGDEGRLAPRVAGTERGAEHRQREDRGDAMQKDIGCVKLELVEALARKRRQGGPQVKEYS